MRPTPVDRHGHQLMHGTRHPSSKFLTQNSSCQMETKMERRQKERPCIDLPNLGYILYTSTKYWQYYWCHIVLADRSLMWLSSETLNGQLTQTDPDTANNWTEVWDPCGRVRELTEGAKRDCNPIDKTTVWTNMEPSELRLSHQPKSFHGVAPSIHLAENWLICQ